MEGRGAGGMYGEGGRKGHWWREVEEGESDRLLRNDHLVCYLPQYRLWGAFVLCVCVCRLSARVFASGSCHKVTVCGILRIVGLVTGNK